MNNYEAIIFDLGNVVFRCSFDPTYEYWAMLSGQSKQDIQRKLQKPEMIYTKHEILNKFKIQMA